MSYKSFIPRLYNYAISLGLTAGKILPSTAFCADETQGYPMLLLAKHFGSFPFSHGRVGGLVASDRHKPYTSHGHDFLILHASHVGFEATSGRFGIYRRVHTENNQHSAACGKIADVLEWYQAAYQFARSNIYLERVDGKPVVTVDNQYVDDTRTDGIYLHFKKLTTPGEDGLFRPWQLRVTGASFLASEALMSLLGEDAWPQQERVEIGDFLLPELFYFKKRIYTTPESQQEGRHKLEENLLTSMPWILTSEAPMLAAAKINTQIEFDNLFRRIATDEEYVQRRILVVSGINIDISPEQQSDVLPRADFVPWAAYFKDVDQTHFSLEQDALFEVLGKQSTENPHQLNLEDAIQLAEENSDID